MQKGKTVALTRSARSALGITEEHPELRIKKDFKSLPDRQGRQRSRQRYVIHQGFSTGGSFAPTGDIYLAGSGYILVIMERGGSSPGIYWAESRNAAKYPAMRRATLTSKLHPSQTSIELRLRSPDTSKTERCEDGLSCRSASVWCC